MKNKAWLVMAIIFLITATLGITAGFDSLLNYTEPVTARLVSSEAYTVRDYSEDGREYKTKYRVTWEYEYGGRTYTEESTYSSRPDSTTTLMVDPDDPTKTTGKHGGVIGLAFGGFSLTLGLLFIKMYRR